MNPFFALTLALTVSTTPVDTTATALLEDPKQTISATIFAYTSTVAQTDASPFTTANGETVRDGIVANNCLPFGTKVTFPKLFGDKTFVVADRMNARYGCNSFDIWFSSLSAAKQFGKRYSAVNVY